MAKKKGPKARKPAPPKAKPAIEITVELPSGAEHKVMLDAITEALREVPIEVLEAGETIIVTNKIGKRPKN
jgi:hypothetical protein